MGCEEAGLTIPDREERFLLEDDGPDGGGAVMYKMALLYSEVSSLYKANEALSKRRRELKKDTYTAWWITCCTGYIRSTRSEGRS